MIFVGVTTLVAGWCNITGIFLPQIDEPAMRMWGIINLVLTVIIMLCVLGIVADALPRWVRAVRDTSALAAADVEVEQSAK